MKELVKLVDTQKNNAWNMRATFLPKKINADAYFQRAMYEVMNNNKIAEIAENPKGAESIFRAITRALQMGLQIGGQFPQASLMPSYDSAANAKVVILVVSANGYKYLALAEPAILKDIQDIPVYEKEIESIAKADESNGEFEYKKIFAGERGKISGVWFRITKLDGRVIGKWIHKDEIKKRMEASPSYKAVKEKKLDEKYCPWFTWSDEMFIGKAFQIVLSPYAKLKEGACLELAVTDDDFETKPIDKRADEHLSKIIDAQSEIVEPENEKKESKPNEKKPAKNSDNKPDLIFD